MSSPYTPVRELFLIGRTLKSHGTAGDLRLLVEDRFKGYVRSGTFVFFDLDGSKVPYQIRSAKDAQHFVVSLKGVDNKEESDALAGKEMWLQTELINPRHLKSPKNLNEQWEAYTIHDEQSGVDFLILRTEEYPQQLMAVVAHKGKEILIPFHDELITNIDKEGKVISMEIPEGLLEL